MASKSTKLRGRLKVWTGRVVAVGVSSAFLTLGPETSVSAQQTTIAAQAAPISKQAAGSSSSANAPVTDSNVYPFQKALDELNGRQGSGPTVPSVSTVRTQVVTPSGAVGGSVYRTSGSRTEAVHMAVAPPPAAPLSASAQKALMIADAEKMDSALPEASKDGRVTYVFGAGLPTVVTSPMHISIIELEPGETMTSEPAIGDSVRWEIMPGSSGKGASLEPLVMLKPHAAGLDTNLVITTDKRTYYLRLVSRDVEYMARTAFSYKDDEDAKWAKFVAAERLAKADREAAQVVTPVGGDAIDNLNFDYEIKGGNAVVRPIRVMDDGSKTYITMPDAVLHQDLPALVVENPKLKGEKAQEMVNYRVKGNLYIVDRLFDRAALVIGSGKAVTKVEIARKTALSGGK